MDKETNKWWQRALAHAIASMVTTANLQGQQEGGWVLEARE